MTTFAADYHQFKTKTMKKKKFLCSLMMASLMLTGCGTMGQQVLTDILTGQQTGSVDAIGNILGSVLKTTTKPTRQQLIGSWTYYQPGCAFTSDKLLAQAGGEVVASQIKTKLEPYYQQLGVKSGNTSVVFKEDGTFSASFAGKAFSGNYSYDESSAKVTMQGLLITLNCYAKRNANGIALLFESSKLLTMLQTLSALSGNATLQGVGEISKSYDGLRVGFDFK